MKRIYFVFILTILFLIPFIRVRAAYAQAYKFELADPGQSIGVGDSFNVKVLINTNNIDSINGDTLIIFDPAKIAITGSQTQNFFTYAFATPLAGVNNKYLASSWEESIAHAKKSSSFTPFYLLTLKAQATGSTQISFDCTNGSEADTNINRASDSKDIVVCPLDPLTINIGQGGAGGGSPTATPPGGGGGNPTATPPGGGGGTSPTSTPVPTAIPLPTATAVPPTLTPTRTPMPTQPPAVTGEMPRAGIANMTIGALGVGTLLTVLGLLFML